MVEKIQMHIETAYFTANAVEGILFYMVHGYRLTQFGWQEQYFTQHSGQMAIPVTHYLWGL